MGVEAFVWAYEHGEPAPLRFATVLQAFDEAGAKWDLDSGCLHLDFGEPENTCEVFVDEDAEARRIRERVEQRRGAGEIERGRRHGRIYISEN